jgi:hypothetical protein
MKIKNIMLTGVAVIALGVLNAPAFAASTQTVTQKTSTVNPDGSVTYDSQSVTTAVPGSTVVTTQAPPVATTTTTVVTGQPGAVVGSVPVTFYYFDPIVSRVVSTPTLSDSVFARWDDDNNRLIDMQEFYRNKPVMYEPVEYSKRTYQDINADGIPDLTQEEYTVRIQQLPLYTSLNRDNKAGMSLYEFIGSGFQRADRNDDNYLDWEELRNAFYGQKFLTAGTGHYN